MSGLSQGISTFSSCNKAGSVPYFTQYLTQRPNDYTALTWRGRAYSIIGENDKAKADFEKAVRVTAPPRKYLAEAHLENISGNGARVKSVLISTVNEFPNCAEAWSELGTHCYHGNEIDKARQYLEKAVNLGKSNGEQGEPWYHWCNKSLGDIHYENDEILIASNCYHEAIRCCNTFTVAYLGSSQCDIVNGNDPRAQESFLKAKDLNPSICPWDDFREFKKVVLQDRQQRGSHSDRHRSSEAYGVSRGGGGGRGGSKGGGGNGSGGDDDDDDPDGSKMLKKIKKEAPEVKKYGGRNYYRSKCGKYWYTKDTAGHGGAFFKKYEDKRSTLEFVGSVDKNLRDMPRKHESALAPTIRKNDMDTVYK
ncbi:uncharacterized protein LOC133190897 [Saccostrea echinata]|uniref:uncharacterized protein LOC133190897 n=1 Tax=Saccostrea echinata TaxID=191078 RepID=UPI002A7F4FA3|nr:uncharacterized protein LOC133190897 [Saccostrea echinata]